MIGRRSFERSFLVRRARQARTTPVPVLASVVGLQPQPSIRWSLDL